MDRNKRYLTQITQRDLQEIADAANIQMGDGIIITRNEKGLEIAVDKQAIRMWVQAILAGRAI